MKGTVLGIKFICLISIGKPADELQFLELYNTAKELDNIFAVDFKSGLIFTDHNALSAITINNKGYTSLWEISILDFLNGFFGVTPAKQLIYRLKRGIVIVRNAN